MANAYCAFTCALLVWGWHELSFLTGWITGPRKTRLPRGTHRLAALRASRCARSCGTSWRIVAVGAGHRRRHLGRSPTRWRTQTFLVLWVMRTSAKLNLFLGVRNLSEEFLPPHLSYLQSFFRRRPMNALLPFSVLGASGVLTLMVLGAAEPCRHAGRGGGHRAGGHDAGDGHRRTPAAGAADSVHRAVALGAARAVAPAATHVNLESHDDLLRAR